MNHLDLFSGIGGFSLAAQRVWGEDHNIVAFVEIDKFCQKVLKKHWPNVPIFSEIKEFTYGDVTNTQKLQCNGEQHNREEGEGQVQKSGVRSSKIDLLTGGFPCQPFSIAGRRKGKTDDRYLWPEMFRIIRETKPTWVVGENVPGILNMGLETTILDLEKEGYEVELFVLPACGVGAWHKRDRVWIVAHSECTGFSWERHIQGLGKIQEENSKTSTEPCESGEVSRDVANSNNSGDRTSEHGTNGDRQTIHERWKRQSQFEPSRQSTIDSDTISNTERSTHRENIRECGGNESDISEGSEMGNDSADICETIPNSSTEGLQGSEQCSNNEEEIGRGRKTTPRSITECGSDAGGYWEFEPNVGRVAHGVPNRVDRLKSLGNSIVPQITEIIFLGIREVGDLK